MFFPAHRQLKEYFATLAKFGVPATDLDVGVAQTELDLLAIVLIFYSVALARIGSAGRSHGNTDEVRVVAFSV